MKPLVISSGGGGGGGLNAGEAFTEAVGAEAGDGLGGVAVATGETVRFTGKSHESIIL